MEENSDTDLFVEFSRNIPSFSLYPLKLLTHLSIMEKVLDPVKINLHSLCTSTYRYVRRFHMKDLHDDGTTLSYVVTRCSNHSSSYIHQLLERACEVYSI
jgi:hypothetical protein